MKDRFSYQVLCHTDLSRNSGESFGTPLNRINWGNFDLVVIDESHNFRNNEAFRERETRYQRLMNRVIQEGVKTKVLMLSATPVNNRFNDLKNQLALAYEGNSETLSKKLRGTRTIEEIFRHAQSAFNRWTQLLPEDRTVKSILNSLDFDFFELLDSVTIARSRKHIQTFYDIKDIGQFPQRRKPLSFHCPLTTRQGIPDFNEIFNHLSSLRLSIYAPMNYVFPSRRQKYEDLYDQCVEGGNRRLRQIDRERSLQALMTTNLLKRLESSVEAFRLTLESLRKNHVRTLEKIDNFMVSKRGSVADLTGSLESLEAEEDDLPISEDDLVGGKVQIDLADMDLPSWKNELLGDQAIIDGLLDSMNKITSEDDAKLQKLKEIFMEKISSPINPGNKKVLIFTAFADTAQYLYDQLSPIAKQRFGLNSAMVSGGSGVPQSTLKSKRKRYDFQEILVLFSPRSKSKDQILPSESAEIDLLIGTDCISEGQNLQDCDYVINYDIHWNPVRIIQRFGRIDRIGSTNQTIQLVNFWPDITLDEYINLKERVENRMIIADVTATGDDNVLTAQSINVAYRKEQLDIGFRVLKVDTSNMEDVYYMPEETDQKKLASLVSNVRRGRTGEDLLFQVMLDWGVDLASPIIVEKKAYPGKTVYFIDAKEKSTFAVCFDDDIDEKFVKKLTETRPRRIVFQESGFASDAVKINVTQIFKQLSPNTEVKTI
jgi:SNF2 family DNA or RNA helicase